MRTVSFIFAFAFLFLGPSMAGSSENTSLPGIGTFAFGGSPAQSDARVVMASVR